MEEELGNEEREETYDLDKDTVRGMKDRDNETLEMTEEENEFRHNLHKRRN